MKKFVFINKNYQKIFLIVFILFANNTFSQKNYPKKIVPIDKNAETNKTKINSIFNQLENIKIKPLQDKINNIGLPEIKKTDQIIKHTAFTLSYNEQHEQANWVVHIVSKDILYGNVSRTNDFRKDSLVSTQTADSVDYWNSGFDRGHLAPSADFRWSKKALSESYFYSNISPQHPDFNRGSWALLENQIREWAIDNDELMIVTGPVLQPNLPKIQQGSFSVSIPKYFYKIIVDYTAPTYKALAFLMPNKKVDYRVIDYMVSIDSIEKLTGINFFPALPDSIENKLEKSNSLQNWDINYQANNGDIAPIDFGKGQIATSQAKYFFGTECTVCGKAVSTKKIANGNTNPIYINLDKKYPNVIFTVVIFDKDIGNFSYNPVEKLYNKTICVKGKVGEYKGTPQIIVNDEKQIEIK